MKTVRVRIAVAVDADGKWCSAGWVDSDDSLEQTALDGLDSARPTVVHFIEADVPMPEPTTVEGSVTT